MAGARPGNGGARPRSGRKPLLRDPVTLSFPIERELHKQVATIVKASSVWDSARDFYRGAIQMEIDRTVEDS